MPPLIITKVKNYRYTSWLNILIDLILIVYYQSTQINGIQIQILAYISSCMIQTDQIARSKAAVIIITGTVNR